MPSATGALPDLNLPAIANPELHKQVIGENEYGMPMAQSTLTLFNGKVVTYDEIVYGYNRLWQDLGMWLMMRWQGVPFLQNANDAIVIQMLLQNVEPSLVVEIGTFNGGSALFYGEVMRNYEECEGCTRLLTIDGDASRVTPKIHEEKNYNIEFVPHLSNSPEAVQRVETLAANSSKVLVIHDGDHSYDGVKRDLGIYDKYVTVGSYIVVQDTSLDRMMTPNTRAECHGGAMKAVKEFVNGPGKGRWVIDKTYEFLLFSTNHNGFLRKVAL